MVFPISNRHLLFSLWFFLYQNADPFLTPCSSIGFSYMKSTFLRFNTSHFQNFQPLRYKTCFVPMRRLQHKFLAKCYFRYGFFQSGCVRSKSSFTNLSAWRSRNATFLEAFSIWFFLYQKHTFRFQYGFPI